MGEGIKRDAETFWLRVLYAIHGMNMVPVPVAVMISMSRNGGMNLL